MKHVIRYLIRCLHVLIVMTHLLCLEDYLEQYNLLINYIDSLKNFQKQEKSLALLDLTIKKENQTHIFNMSDDILAKHTIFI